MSSQAERPLCGARSIRRADWGGCQFDREHGGRHHMWHSGSKAHYWKIDEQSALPVGVEPVTDFGMGSIEMSWETWRKLPLNIKEAIQTYNTNPDAFARDRQLIFHVASYRVEEINIMVNACLTREAIAERKARP